MSNRTESKDFIFNNKIDRDALFALYDTDYAYMQEIFSITLAELKPDLQQFRLAFQKQDMENLRRLAHKMKPSFGFVGLPSQQTACKKFEDICSAASAIASIEEEFHTLSNSIEQYILVLEEEYERLKDFNGS